MHPQNLPGKMFQSRLGRSLVSGLLALALLALTMAFPPAARAASYVVTSAGDSGPGTLRQAILDANAAPGADTITFASNLSGPITLLSALTISDALTISGPGKTQLSIVLNEPARLLIYDSNDSSFLTVAISGLSLTGTGSANAPLTTLESLTLDDVGVSNMCSKKGPLHAYEISVYDQLKPAITIRNSSFSDNLCEGLDAAAGGLFSESANVLIENSTFNHNSGYWAGAINAWDGDLTITNTTISNNSAYYYGAGISTNYNSLLSVSGSTISNNTAGFTGGGIYSYSATGPFTLQTSTVTGNSAGYSGGGVAAYLYDVPLAPSAPARPTSDTEWEAMMAQRMDQPRAVVQEPICESSVTIPMNDLTDERIINLTGSQISGNHVTKTPSAGNPGSGGGVYLEEVQAKIQDSSISGNDATGYGGGVAACASPLEINGSTVAGNNALKSGGGLAISLAGSASLLQNSTISGNQGLTGGGMYLYKTGDLNLKLLTTADNQAVTSGGGLEAANGTGASSCAVLIENSIVAQNTVGGAGQDLSTTSALIDLAYSLVQAAGTANLNNPPGSGNLLGQDPLLGSLQDNGGPSFTHLPAGSSPVIDAGNPAFAAPPAGDQRGSPRVVFGRVDMGAVEVQAAAGTLALSPVSAETVEGNKTVTFSVTRSGGADGAVTVDYSTSNGTATAGADYIAASGTLSWANGESGAKTFTVTILDDAQTEANETINLALASATGGAALGASQAVLTITDNDVPPAGSLAFTAAAIQAGEGSKTVTFSVTRSSGSNGAVSVAYSTNGGSATAGADYTAAAGTLSWANGETGTKTFTVTILEDVLKEADETVTVRLANATGGASIATPTATLTILDNDYSLLLPIIVH